MSRLSQLLNSYTILFFLSFNLPSHANLMNVNNIDIDQINEERNMIAFVDPEVNDYKTLVNAIASSMEVFILDPTRDGVRQITQILKQHTDLSEVHIFSHGSVGRVQLGNTWLSANNLDNYRTSLQHWFSLTQPQPSNLQLHSIPNRPDLLLYGCEVAAGTEGLTLVQTLSELTGADVAASVDRTGNAQQDGNWTLEVATGTVVTPLKIPSYQSVLSREWAKKWGSNSSDQGKNITLDNEGNIYLTGQFFGTMEYDPSTAPLESTGGHDIFIFRLDASGNVVWANQLGGNGNDEGSGIVVDGGNQIYLIGSLVTDSGDKNIVIAKLDHSNGEILWEKQFGSSEDDEGYGIAVDSENNIYITGRFAGTVEFDSATVPLESAGGHDIFIAKLNSSGDVLWANQMGGTDPDEVGYGIVVDDSRSKVYSTGYFRGTAYFDLPSPLTSTDSSRDVFIVQANSSDGQIQWAQKIGHEDKDEGRSIAVDNQGNIYTVGIFEDMVDFDPNETSTFALKSVGGSDIFILKLNSNGEFITAWQIGGRDDDEGASVIVDSEGGVYTTGFFRDTIELGDFELSSINNSMEIFLAKLDRNGQFVYAKQFISLETSDQDQGQSIAVDNRGHVYITGTFDGSIEFGPAQTLTTSVGNYDIFVHQLYLNYAPVLDNTGLMSLNEINEDIADLDNSGTLISDIISRAGGDRIYDSNANPEGIAVIAVNNTHGQWQYDHDEDGIFINFPAGLTESQAILLNDKVKVRFVPHPDYFGTVNPGMTFRAWDGTVGNNGDSNVDTTFNGGLTAFSVNTETALITIKPVVETPKVSHTVTQEDVLSTKNLVIDRNGDTAITHFKITHITGGTLFQSNGLTPISEGEFITYEQGSVGLRFLSLANSFADGSFEIQASTTGDNTGLGGDIVTANITINPVADDPKVTSAKTDEGVQTSNGLVISRNSADGEEVTHFKITEITGGKLFQNDGTTPIYNHQFITVAEGHAGLKFTPSSDQNGRFAVQAALTDSDRGLGGKPVIATIDVNLVNDPPHLDSIGDQTLILGETLTFTATAHDSDVPPNHLVFKLTDAPSGAMIDPSTGLFTWQATQSGIFNATVEVTETNGNPNLSDSETITITVENTAPVLNLIGNQAAAPGSVLTWMATATDAEQNDLTFSLAEAPASAIINPVTGQFTWIASEAGVFNTTVVVTDSGGLSDSETIAITVGQEPILAPIGNKTIAVSSSLTFTAHATHPDNNPLIFSLTEAPAGATIDATTGVFNWTPTDPGLVNVTVTVIDSIGGGQASETITITTNLAATCLHLKLSSIAIFTESTLSVTGQLHHYPNNESNLQNLPIQLTITAPNGQVFTQNTHISTPDGQYVFAELPSFNQEGQYLFQTQFAGNTFISPAQSDVQSVIVRPLAGYALLVQGRIAEGTGMETYNKSLNRVYRKLTARGFSDDNIEYFNFNPNQHGITIDGTPNKPNIQMALKRLQDRMNTTPGPLYVILADHGDVEGSFYIDDGTGTAEMGKITPAELNNWLSNLENHLNALASTQPRIIIIGACYSGSSIPTLSKPGRVIITSTAASEESYKGPKEADDIRSGEFFLEALFHQFGLGKSLKTAFELATQSTETLTRINDSVYFHPWFQDRAVQHPLLDDDGNQQGSNSLFPAQGDGGLAKDIYLGVGPKYDINAPNNPAEIFSVTPTRYLSATETVAELLAQVKNPNRVAFDAVTVDIRPPSVTLTRSGIEQLEQLEIETLDRLFLLKGNDRFTGQFEHFHEPGKYEILYFVTDTVTGERSSLERSIVYKDNVHNHPPRAVDLRFPESNSYTYTTLILEWEKTFDPDGDPVTYTLILSTDPDFNYEIYRSEDLLKTITYIDHTTPIDDPLNSGKLGLRDGTPYYWKVEAIDQFGAKTASPTFSFTTNNTNAPPGVGSLRVFSAVSFSTLDEVNIDFFQLDEFGNLILDEFGNPIPIEPNPLVHEDEGHYNMLLPFGRRRAILQKPGFVDQEIEVKISDAVATVNIEMQPVGGIPENQGQLEFAAASTYLIENQGIVNLIVNRVEGRDGDISVSYTTSADDTAIKDRDYMIENSGTLTWADGDTLSKRIPITLIDDQFLEGEETFTLILHTPTGGATLGTHNEILLTIIDDKQNDQFPPVEDSEAGDVNVGSASTSSDNPDTSSNSLPNNNTDEPDNSDTGNINVSGNDAITHDADNNDTSNSNADNNDASGSSESNSSAATHSGEFDDNDTNSSGNNNASNTVNSNSNEEATYQTTDTSSNTELSDPNHTSETDQTETTAQNPLEETSEPSILQFSAAAYFVEEGEGILTEVTVNHTGDNFEQVSVQYITTGETTATLNQDYLGGYGTLTWEAGDTTSKAINLTLIEDNDEETEETIHLHLVNPTGNATLGSIATTTLTLIDNDQTESWWPGTLQFPSPLYSANENAGTLQTITVVRKGGSRGEISVQYRPMTSTTTATFEQDYLGGTGTLFWADGDEEAKTLPLMLIDDAQLEKFESIHLKLFNPTGGAILDQFYDTTYLVITDNDDNPVALPNLGQGIVIITNHQTVNTSLRDSSDIKTVFRGGASLNGRDYYSTLTIAPSQFVKIIGEIGVETSHVGQNAELLVVAALLSSDSQFIDLLLMLNNQQEFEVWDGNLDTLIAKEESVTLSSTQVVKIYQNQLEPGHLLIFFGYRLANEIIVFNGNQPIEIKVE